MKQNFTNKNYDIVKYKSNFLQMQELAFQNHI
jgi:hypothetical protein